MIDAGNRGQQGGAAGQLPEASAGPAVRISGVQIEPRLLRHRVVARGVAMSVPGAFRARGRAIRGAIARGGGVPRLVCGYWSELTSAGGGWQGMATESCASARESLAPTCEATSDLLRARRALDAQIQQKDGNETEANEENEGRIK